MKLYLVDNHEISIYSLPSKVEDAFVINYMNCIGKEETITFTAEDEKWLIQSTSEMTITKNSQLIDKDFLENDTIYHLRFSDLNDTITIYCFDIHQTFYDFLIPSNKNELTIGGTGSFDIVYNHENVGSPELKIYRQNNYWVLEDNGAAQTRVYVNNRRVRKTFLKFGDVIFTNGLKLIWLDSFVRLNNPQEKVSTSLSLNATSVETKNEYTPVTDFERSIVLYNDNQVFFHTPRMKEVIVEKEIGIERPPQIVALDDMPMILSVGTTAVMGVSSLFTGIMAVSRVSSGKASIGDVSTELILCITMVIGSIILPIIIDKYNKKRLKRREETRKQTYREYLDSIREEIKEEIDNEVKILNNNYLNVGQLQNLIHSKSSKIWNREITDSDFLTLRLGLGTRNSAINLSFSKIAFDIDKDVLITEAQELANQKLVLENVPMTISLIDNNILPLVISESYGYQKQFINYLMLQLISYYSGNDLKIVIFTTKNELEQWEPFKYLPHCADETRKFRFFADNEEEAKQVSNYLEKIYQKRSNASHQKNDPEEEQDDDSSSKDNSDEGKDAYQSFDSYYLIITDNYISVKQYGIIQKILNSNGNIGFSLITIEPTMQNVPSKCEKMIVVNNDSAGIVNKSLNENDNNNMFTPDLLMGDIKNYCYVIGNIPLAIESTAGKLPKSLSFLDIYKVGKIEQLNVLNRWAKNDPTMSIASPIGVHEDGKVFEIDLHEKFHGPHGLIAGSTGSGKSEFIITFVLSLAINYHPYEVQFVLIDYKGGGLAGAFENKETGLRLPHLAGTITNLDVSEMNRTLVSINSELKRRQRIFNEARDSLNESTIDIYKYQKFYREGKVKEPISHLFIISDEFAELKSQQPDFMDSLVSTARIGRSLGVHLILATQKPSGVVDDQIWSNARFKVCLKVATAEDSRELLRRPEAAEIKETGRFYLQVGFNELFELGQAAWAGAKYNPTDHIVKDIDATIDFIDNVGSVVKSVDDEKVENQENHADQLTSIVNFLYTLALRENINFKSLWLPNIPTTIYLADLIKKYQYQAKPYYIQPLVGEYDDPEKQFQGEFTIDFVENGNLLIYGLANTGKENLITTILYSICMYHSSKEVNIYILDFGAQVLKAFKEMPQVGDIAFIDDADKIKSALLMLEREITRRRELFSEHGGSYIEYIKHSGEKLPMIFVVLNGWEAFIETYQSYVDVFSHLSRECSKFGIIFITTMITTNSMLSSTQQNFENKIALQLSDKFDYRYLLNAKHDLVPKNAFSRGLATIKDDVYEFQGAYIFEKSHIADVIKQSADQAKETQEKAPPIPIIPNTITADTLTPYISDLTSIPVGINIHNAEVFGFDFKKNRFTQVIGNFIITHDEFLIELLKILNLVQNTKLKIFDFADAIDDPSEFEYYYNDNFTENINQIIESEKTETKQMIYVFIGIGRIYDKVLDAGIETCFKIFNNYEKFQKSSFIILDNYSIFRKAMKEDWYSRVKSNVGIWVGADIENQTAITCSNMTNADLNEEFNGIIYVANGEESVVLKGIGSRPEEEY